MIETVDPVAVATLVVEIVAVVIALAGFILAYVRTPKDTKK